MLICAPHLLPLKNRSKVIKICLFRVRLLVTPYALLLIVPPASRVAWSTEDPHVAQVLGAVLAHFASCVWMTYRRDFPSIGAQALPPPSSF